MIQKSLVAASLVLAGNAQAQSGNITLLMNMPVYQFVRETNHAHSICELIELSYWSEIQMRSYGKGNPESEYRELVSCIRRQKDAPREKLLAALKYLSDKPASSKALKEFYLKWTASLESMAPGDREAEKAHSERKRKAIDTLKESQRALELELELGM